MLFLNWEQNKQKLQKSYFFLVANPPPSLSGRAIEKITFVTASLISSMCG